ncbi:MAG: TraB/GumN family protein [Saprospiraceae bacterium]|nr:TraB/GumN family protein [Saprospiraceae bacterium]
MIRFMISCLLLLTTVAVMAQTVQQPEAATATRDDGKLENALLWKIEGDSVAGVSWLFGTIHLISADEFFMPPGTEEAIAASETLVFEIDMAEMTDLGAQLSMFAKAFMKGGVRLRDLVSDEDYTVIKAHFEEIGIPLFMLERIKPMFLSIFATGDFTSEDFMGGGTTSYEMEFYTLAQQNGAATGGLETMEYQISVFDSIPYDEQAQMLVETIKMGDQGNEQFDEMMRAYKAQDVDGLYAMTTSGDSDLGEYEGLLLDDRNANWIAGMKKYMAGGPTFFAVGAAHLGGPEGVIRLLRAEGFTVTPVLSDTRSRPMKRF